MDGLTVSTSDALLKTGQTASELRDMRMRNEAVDLPDSDSHSSFADTLKDAVGRVNTLQKDADFKIQQLATGKAKNIPDVMVASEKADVAFRLMMQVRNKIIDAYQEIMKMQV